LGINQTTTTEVQTMTQTLQQPTITTTEYKPKTISDMQAIYRTVHKFEKQAGNEANFLKRFGTEKQWLNKFKKTTVDQ
jgi:hypothetical protein